MTGNGEQEGGFIVPAGADPRDRDRGEFNVLFSSIVLPQIQAEKRVLGSGVPDEVFLKRRVPVYVDAFSRGFGPVLQELESQPVVQELAADRAKRILEFQKGGLLRWRITAGSEDPIEIFRFQEAVRDSGVVLEGEHEIWRDPYLLQLAVTRGRSEQRGIFSRWHGLYNAIRQRESGMSETGQFQFLKYFYKPVIYEVSGEGETGRRRVVTDSLMFRDVKGLAIPETDQGVRQQEHFIESRVVSGEIPAGLLNRVETTINSIDRLENLFTRIDRDSGREVSEPYNERLRREDSLVAELFTNPAVLESEARYKRPRITRQRLESYYRILDRIESAGKGDEGLQRAVFLTVEDLLSRREQEIMKMLDSEGIDVHTGFLYLRSLIGQRLNHHIAGRTSRKGIDRAVFVLEGFNIGSTASPNPEEIEESREFYDHMKYEFIMDQLMDNPVRFNTLNLFTNQARYVSAIFDGVINYDRNAENGANKLWALSILIDRMRLGLDLNDEPSRPESYGFTTINLDTFMKYQSILEKKLADGVENGNGDLIEVLEHKVLGSFYNRYLEDRRLFKPLSGGRSSSTRGVARQLQARIGAGAVESIPLDPGVNLSAEEGAVLLFLNEYFNNPLKADLDSLAAQFVADLAVLPNSESGRIINEKLLSGQNSEAVYKLITSGARQIMTNIWMGYFAPGLGPDRNEGLRAMVLGNRANLPDRN